MGSPTFRLKPVECVLGGLLFCGVIGVSGEARAQTQPPAADGSKAGAKGQQKAPPSAGGKSDRRGAAGREARGPSEPPSAAYQESLRRTVERRRQRRARQQQNAGDAAGAVGAIVPWPMPPALIIRHTREVHGDVGSLLFGLRR
jgi:hypothetical protein